MSDKSKKNSFEEFRGGWYRIEIQTGGKVQEMRGVLRDIKPKLFGRAIRLRVWSLFTLDGPGRWEDNGALVYARPVLLPAPTTVTPVIGQHSPQIVASFRSQRGTKAAYVLNIYGPSPTPPWN